MPDALRVGHRTYSVRVGQGALDRHRVEPWFFVSEGGRPDQTVVLDLSSRQWRITSGSEVLVTPAYPGVTPASLAQLTTGLLFGVQADGRQFVHAAAVVPKGLERAVLLIGDSGFGKSTLALKALLSGHRLLSDDGIAAFIDKSGDVLAAPVRKYLSVEESLQPDNCRGFWIVDSSGRRKFSFDPETVFESCRPREALVEALVFLERGDALSIRPITGAAAYERLLSQCPDVFTPILRKQRLGILRALATTARARVARLTKESLSDAGILDDLLS